jgi:hypothetical protein
VPILRDWHQHHRLECKKIQMKMETNKRKK